MAEEAVADPAEVPSDIDVELWESPPQPASERIKDRLNRYAHTFFIEQTSFFLLLYELRGG